MRLPLAETKTTGRGDLEAMGRSSVSCSFGVGCLRNVQGETSVRQLNTRVWNSGEPSGDVFGNRPRMDGT